MGKVFKQQPMPKDFKINNSWFRRTNFKAISFFLIFSFIIWLLVQFSKTYEEIVQIPVVYTGIPKDKIVSEEKKHLEVRLQESGFGIAWISLFKEKLPINLSELPTNENEIIFSTEENALEISEKLGVDLGEIEFLDDTLKIPYRQKATKKLAVIPQITISFKPGYGSADSLLISPDTIKVSGPKSALDSLKSISTKKLDLKEVDKDLKGTVAIDSSKLKNIALYQPEVSYSMNVEKFTEGKLEVPLFVVNAPEDNNIVIFPKNILVIFQVSLEDFKQISKGDFRVVCDYQDLREGQEFFIPKVVKKPESISNLRLGTKKIQFVIKK